MLYIFCLIFSELLNEHLHLNQKVTQKHIKGWEALASSLAVQFVGLRHRCFLIGHLLPWVLLHRLLSISPPSVN